MKMVSTEQLLTPPEVARALRIETYDVLVLIEAGQLPRVKGGDGLIYVPAEAVDAFARSNR